MRLNFVSILISFISTTHSLMRFQMKNQCESKREVALVANQYGMENQFKTIVTNLKEACVNITLVKLELYGIVNNLNPIELSFGHWLSQFVLFHDRTHLKEYLQLFAKEFTKKRRTLVVFNYYFDRHEIEILYNLQMENNVDVIIVSISDRILNLEQFPRHLKILTHYSPYNLKGLIDVIRNPLYNRFEFEKNLASFKNRSCLKNVKIIMISYSNPYTNYNILQFIKYYNQENLDGGVLDDVYFKNTFTQLSETDIMKGSKQKLFICYYRLPDKTYHEKNNNKTRNMETSLKNNKQRVVTLQQGKLYPNEHEIEWIFRIHGNNHEYDIRTKEGIEFLMDLLVDAGCK